MISRALIRLSPFLCLLVLAASAKHDDNRSRRMSSTGTGYYGKKELNRRLKGMDKNNKTKDESSAPPPMENDWRRLEGTDRANTRSIRRELRFLKEKSSTTKTKTKDDSKSKNKSKSKSKSKGKTDPKSTEIPRPVSPTPPPTVAVTPAPTPVDRERERGIVSGVEAVVYDNDDGLLH